MFRAGMVAVAAALLGSTSAHAQSAAWTISEASGRVVIRDTAGDHPGARGAAVPAGATVMTGATGRAVLVRNQDFVTLSANARMRLPEAAKAGGLFQVIQEWGNALFRIEHRQDPHFAVQAPYLAAVVKGTTFSVTVTREGSSVQVIEGAVEAATADGGAHELVRPGTVASVMASDRFRLSVQGQNAHNVDSPARGRTGASAAPTPPAPNGESKGGGDRNDSGAVEGSAAGGADSPAAGYDDIAWQQVANSVVATPIEAKPADLGKITDGLVSGKSNGTAMASAVAVARAETSGAGNGNGASNGSVNGNSSGSANGSSNGNGNGSGNGNANGTGNGNGNGNSGNGNGNGNSGNGNGNGNSGNGNGNGNSGNGNGNGNSGNGNGNGNSGNGNGNGNSGNGNGNGNSGNGNGNGNSGNGNGNGNSGNGNGNGNSGNGNGNGNSGNGNGNGNSGNGNGNGGGKSTG